VDTALSMTMMPDEDPECRRFGKWSMPGFPHSGWTCIDIENLGAPDAICEMCERQDIRYVHAMEHPDYPEAAFGNAVKACSAL